MHKYIKMLDLLAQSPHKYLARTSVQHLESFLAGFQNVSVVGIENLNLLMPLTNGFAKYLANKYDDGSVKHRGIYLHGYDDLDSVDLYFKEWFKFCGGWAKSKGIVVSERQPSSPIDLFKIFDHIRRRPGFYFPKRSIELLYSHVRGLQCACECYAPMARVTPDLGEFEKKLRRKYGLKKISRWDRVLLAENGFDDEVAFNNFFEEVKWGC